MAPLDSAPLSAAAAEAAQPDEAVIAAARAVFTARGYHGARLEDLALATGLDEAVLTDRFGGRLGLFTAVLVSLEKALDAHCRAVTLDAIGPPIAVFMAGCRASLEFAGRRDFARIVMIEGPGVLGEDAWIGIDHGLGLPTVRQGLRNLAPHASAAAVRPMALMVMGALNETILGLARGDEGIDIDGSLAVLEKLLRTWAEVPRHGW